MYVGTGSPLSTGRDATGMARLGASETASRRWEGSLISQGLTNVFVGQGETGGGVVVVVVVVGGV